VIVSHGGGLSTLYGHQSRLGVSLGQAVGAGQIIGYVGSTGHSTGPHVHFETRYGGVARNPRGCLG
jgi:murein DD-endopeptidase MepM/ murein hydrolase activator NlpD